MAANNHNIRLEYGIHEKTKRNKSLVRQRSDYPRICKLPTEVWDKYSERVRKILTNKLINKTKGLDEHPLIKWMLSTPNIRQTDDGRERSLFVLIHVLKSKYKEKKGEFIRFLQDWYRYSGGTKLSGWAIQCKINYHWEREYHISNTYLNNLVYELGLEERFKKE